MAKWLGAIIGAVIGAGIGNGFFGFLAGGALGYYLGGRIENEGEDDKSLSDALREIIDTETFDDGDTQDTSRRRFADTEPRSNRLRLRRVLLENYAMLLLEVAKADRIIHNEEIDTIIRCFRLMNFPRKDLSELRYQLHEQIHEETSFTTLTQPLLEFTIDERILLMEGLCRVAFADQELHPSESQLLQALTKELQLHEHMPFVQAALGRSRIHFGYETRQEPLSLQEAYVVLGLPPESNLATVQQRTETLLNLYENPDWPNLNPMLGQIRKMIVTDLTIAIELLADALPAQQPSPTLKTPPPPPSAQTNTAAPSAPPPQQRTQTPQASPIAPPLPIDAHAPLDTQAALAELWGTGSTEKTNSTENTIPTTRRRKTTTKARRTRQKAQHTDKNLQFKRHIEALSDFDQHKREEAIHALTSQGPQVITKLIPHMDNFIARDGITEVLRRLQGDPMPALQHAIDAVEPLEKDWLLQLSAELGGHNASPILLHYLQGDDALLQHRARQELERIGYSHQEIQALKEAS